MDREITVRCANSLRKRLYSLFVRFLGFLATGNVPGNDPASITAQRENDRSWRHPYPLKHSRYASLRHTVIKAY